MGRMAGALMFFVFLHLGMYIFLGAQLPGSTLVNALLGIEDWTANPFVNYLSDVFALVGTGTILLTLTGYIKSDFPIYAGIAFAFLGFGQAYYEVYQRLVAENVLWSQSSPILLVVFAGTIIVMWFMILLEFMRGRD